MKHPMSWLQKPTPRAYSLTPRPTLLLPGPYTVSWFLPYT